ncbi:MAG: SDR family NAD(P)-dependent oxidoreductase [Burkholderiales bacterium]|nr:MAG: SDR family NAD(P)-dependent oxidoreductase [Burkholderiales bacterium]
MGSGDTSPGGTGAKADAKADAKALSPAPAGAVVVGASGGLGAAFVAALRARADVSTVLALSRSGPHDDGAAPEAGVVRARIDLTDEASIAAAAALARTLAPPRWVIVATGLLHAPDGLRPEKSLAMLDGARMARLFAVNATGPALVAKHFLPLMPREGRAVFAAVSARVGSISDNRLGGWYGYRASKAALNMLLRTAAIEWARTAREGVCVGLHPGTVDTALSRPFQAGVPEGRLFGADESAAKLLAVLDGLGPADSGRVFAWDGSEVPA